MINVIILGHKFVLLVWKIFLNKSQILTTSYEKYRQKVSPKNDTSSSNIFSGEGETTATEEPSLVAQQPTVIPGQDSLIITDDLLNMNLGGPMSTAPQTQTSAGMDLLGDGLDSLVSGRLLSVSVIYV